MARMLIFFRSLRAMATLGSGESAITCGARGASHALGTGASTGAALLLRERRRKARTVTTIASAADQVSLPSTS